MTRTENADRGGGETRDVATQTAEEIALLRAAHESLAERVDTLLNQTDDVLESVDRNREKPYAGYEPVTVAYDYADLRGSHKARLTSIDDVVERHLNARLPHDWPKTLEVTLWTRKRVEEADVKLWADLIVTRFGEALDDDNKYSHPQKRRKYELKTAQMANLAQAFAREALRAVDMYWCDPLPDTVKVNISAWVAAHRPDWVRRAP